ncbi:hypothetical protein IE53DRAFT_384577 [Violaceomyces palustris]|uniref:Uncharacterized protein n=1 Tax=Violaceomyces palustris TaxID=1673888 RepID=A0ACD0P4L2_9BASI|nr:hypothetical protein IE53DRAFT_384577 [Violaceomyces palustris]
MPPRTRDSNLGLASHFKGTKPTTTATNSIDSLPSSKTPSSAKPKSKSSKTRLRTPDEHEVRELLDQIPPAPKRFEVEKREEVPNDSASGIRPSTPPPAPPPLPGGGTPPSSLGRNPSLLEPIRKSPLSVRQDPDTGKLYIIMPSPSSLRSPSKRPVSPTKSGSPLKRKHSSPSSPSPSPSKAPISPTTRKGVVSAATSTPTTAKSLGPLMGLGIGIQDGSEEDGSGIRLEPGKGQGKRVKLGSPKDVISGSLATSNSRNDVRVLSPGASTPTSRAKARTLLVEEEEDDDDDDGLYITPRSVRERPTGRKDLVGVSSQLSSKITFESASLPDKRGSVPLPLTRPSGDVERILRNYPKPARDDFFGGNDVTTEKGSMTPTRQSLSEFGGLSFDSNVLPYGLSPSLPLPPHYSTLLSLHTALEHALVVHLATSGASTSTSDDAQVYGPRGDGSPTSSPSFPSSSSFSSSVRLPNLITFTALRPLVERSGGRRFGSTELARLVGLWSQGGSESEGGSLQDRDQDSNPLPPTKEEIRGLGFIVTKTRALDPRSGKKVWDWGVGIELNFSRQARQVTPPLEVTFQNVPTTTNMANRSPSLAGPHLSSASATGVQVVATPSTPPPASRRRGRDWSVQGGGSDTPGSLTCSSPSLMDGGTVKGHRTAREGMSIVALWNNGIEARKAEVARRLRLRVAVYHSAWLKQMGLHDTSTSTSSGDLCRKEGEADQLLTSPLRSESWNTGEVPQTPSSRKTKGTEEGGELRRGQAMPGPGGLLTPASTRSGCRRIGGRIIHFDPSQLDQDRLGDNGGQIGPEGEEEERDSYRLPPEGGLLEGWHPRFDFSSPNVVKPLPLANLPSLRDPNPSGSFSGFASSSLSTPSRALTMAQRRELQYSRPHSRCGGESGTTVTDLPSTPRSGPSSGGEAILKVPNTAPAMTLKERIAAKEEAKRLQLLNDSKRPLVGDRKGTFARTRSAPLVQFSSSSSSWSDPVDHGVPSHPSTPSKGSIMANFKRRSTLSRLADISDALYLLFTTHPSTSATPSKRGVGGGGGRGKDDLRTPTLPLNEILSTLTKSSKVTMSRSECRQALQLLIEIAPGFLEIVKVGNSEWARLGRIRVRRDADGGGGEEKLDEEEQVFGEGDPTRSSFVQGKAGNLEEGVGDGVGKVEYLPVGMGLNHVRERIREELCRGL